MLEFEKQINALLADRTNFELNYLYVLHEHAVAWLSETKNADRFVGLMMHFCIRYSNSCQPQRAEIVLGWCLKVIKEVDNNIPKDNALHKGSLFYFWGLMALHSDNFDKALYLIHKSLLEDQRQSNNFKIIPNTPAAMFARLDASSNDQFAYPFVLKFKEQLTRFVDEFAEVRDKEFNVEKLDSRFLKTNEMEMWVNASWFIYCFLRYDHIRTKRLYELCDSPFGILFLQTLAGDICVLIENLAHGSIKWYCKNTESLRNAHSYIEESEKHRKLMIEKSKQSGENELEKERIWRSNEIIRILDECDDSLSDYLLGYLVRNHANHRNEKLEVSVDGQMNIIRRLFFVIFDMLTRSNCLEINQEPSSFGQKIIPCQTG